MGEGANGGEEIMGCEREAAEGEKEGEAMDGNLKEVKTAEGRGKPGAHVQEVTPPSFSSSSRSHSRIVMRGRISSSFLHRALCVHRGGEAKREKNE